MAKSEHKHSHGASCGPGHHHAHHVSGSLTNISIALALNMGFAVIELIGGFWTQSTAIQADAIHDFGDAAALGAALILQFISRLPPREGFSYGLKRFSLLSAVLTAILLILGSVFVTYQAFERIGSPVVPHLNGMLGLAVLGVAVNGFAALKMSRGHSQNEKALTWHMLEDLLGWVAVLISSIVMRFWESPWLDPLLAIIIGLVVLSGAGRSLWTSIRLFLQAVPRGISAASIRDGLKLKYPSIHIQDLKIWSLDGEHHVCTLRVDLPSDCSVLKWNDLKSQLTREIQQFGKIDLTVEPTFKD